MPQVSHKHIHIRIRIRGIRIIVSMVQESITTQHGRHLRGPEIYDKTLIERVGTSHKSTKFVEIPFLIIFPVIRPFLLPVEKIFHADLMSLILDFQRLRERECKVFRCQRLHGQILNTFISLHFHRVALEIIRAYNHFQIRHVLFYFKIQRITTFSDRITSQ